MAKTTEPQMYVCGNETCTLGEPGKAGGLFTGGMQKIRTEDDVEVLAPAEGFCPNCHEKGTKFVPEKEA